MSCYPRTQGFKRRLVVKRYCAELSFDRSCGLDRSTVGKVMRKDVYYVWRILLPVTVGVRAADWQRMTRSMTGTNSLRSPLAAIVAARTMGAKAC